MSSPFIPLCRYDVTEAHVEQLKAYIQKHGFITSRHAAQLVSITKRAIVAFFAMNKNTFMHIHRAPWNARGRRRAAWKLAMD